MRRGFTLVELVVALTLSGMALLLVARLFSTLASATVTLRDERQAFTRRENAHRWLGSTLLSLEAGVIPDESFDGYADHCAFTSWLLTPRGWFERRRVRLALEGSTVQAHLDDGATLILADSIARLRIDYLLEPGATTHWATGWLSPVSAPLALRLRLTPLDTLQGADTLLLLIKERG